MKPPINDIHTDVVKAFKTTLQGYNHLDTYQRLATQTAIYPGKGTPLGMAYVALKMNGEAGEFAEHVGKAMRDDAYGPETPLTPERHELLVKEVGDVLWYLSAACNELGICLSDVASTNLMKLAARHANGTLQGSGDDR